MVGVGVFLLVLGALAGVYWLLEAKKAGKIQSVPFKKPAEIAAGGPAAGDAKGLVSCEGTIVGNPLTAPMSGQPCLYWEVELLRKWEKKSVNSQGQTTTSSGSTSVLTQKQGGVFGVTDGTGTIGVDLNQKPDSDLKESHSSEVKIGLIIPSELNFGNMRTQVPHLPGGDTTKAFRGVEKTVPFSPQANYFVLGKITQGPQGLQLGPTTWGSVMISDKGREATLGTAVKNAKIGKFSMIGLGAVGAILTIIGVVTSKPAAADATAAGSASAAPGAAAAALPAGKPAATAAPHATAATTPAAHATAAATPAATAAAKPAATPAKK